MILTFYTHATPIPPSSGWTTLVPSEDSRIVYVSSSDGDDMNDGLSEEEPKETIAAGVALLRNGYPDYLLFKRGDTFSGALGTITLAGRSTDELMVIGAYGTGARPIIDTGDAGFILLNGYVDGVAHAGNYLAFVGLDLYPSGRDPDTAYDETNTVIGIHLTYGDSILVEDCRVRFYSVGIDVGECDDVSIRRNEITHQYDGAGSHSQGMLVHGVDGFTLEENVIDHNGWINASDADNFNHNIYIKESCTGCVIHGNIIARGSSHGLQARSGGDVTDNLFIDNPVHLSFGLVNGAPVFVGGVEGTVSGNVFIGGRDIDGSPRGYAIEFGNIKPVAGAVCENNLFVGDGVNTESHAAIEVSISTAVDNSEDDEGINDLTIRQNVFYGWYQGISVHPELVPGGTGGTRLSGLVVQDNDFQATTSGVLINHECAFDGDEETFSGNRYHTSGDGSAWFLIDSVTTSITTWLATIDTTGTNTDVSYSDPTLTIGDYSESIGDTATTAAFLSNAAGQHRLTWQDKYTADPAIAFMMGGWDL